MQESEAKKKWCPMTRVLVEKDTNLSSFNRFGDKAPSGSLCIASECMWWVPDWSCGADNPGGRCGAINVKI